MNGDSAFTPMELLNVMFITEIPAAIGLPDYLNSTIRTLIAEDLFSSTHSLSDAAAYDAASSPSDNTSAGIAPADSINGRHVTFVTLDAKRKVAIAYRNSANLKLAGQTLRLSLKNEIHKRLRNCAGLPLHYMRTA